jgi:inorganic pyrophosphatase
VVTSHRQARTGVTRAPVRPVQTRPRVPRSLDTLAPYEGDDLRVVIETPKGSQNKYAYEPSIGTFVLRGVLPAGAVFPFDFGFVPSTLGEDGDPLDILVLMDSSAFAGCLVPSRLIGAIEAEQTENGKTERNDRLLAVASHSLTHKSIQDISDLSSDLVGQIGTSSSRTTWRKARRSHRRVGAGGIARGGSSRTASPAPRNARDEVSEITDGTDVYPLPRRRGNH